MTDHGRLLVLATVTALLAGAAATAGADLDVGEPARAVAPLAVVRGPAPLPEALLGRVVLLEFFSTKCPHCQAEVAHLNALQRRFGPRGLLVVALSHESAGAAQAFARDWRVEYAMSVTGGDVLRDYDVPSFPRSVLLDASGHVLWRGHPARLSDAEVEAAIAAGGLKPAVPAALAWADAGLARGEWAATRARLEALVRESPKPTDTTRAADDLAAWIGWLVRARRAAAERHLDGGRPWDALVALESLAASVPGTPAGEEAAARAAAIAEDPAHGREIEAGRAFAEARARRPASGDRESLEAFRAVVSRWPGTRGALRAAVFVRDLEKAVARTAPRR